MNTVWTEEEHRVGVCLALKRRSTASTAGLIPTEAGNVFAVLPKSRRDHGERKWWNQMRRVVGPGRPRPSRMPRAQAALRRGSRRTQRDREPGEK